MFFADYFIREVHQINKFINFCYQKDIKISIFINVSIAVFFHKIVDIIIVIYR